MKENINMMGMKKIAVILTCFNRRSKTLKCLESLFFAQQNYTLKTKEEISLSVFLTDDGCTDGTADAVMDMFPHKSITIIKGNGNLFWAGGMRLAWQKAIEQKTGWDYYLLINDDAIFLDTCFNELYNTETYCIKKFGKQGIYSGITVDPEDHSQVTYGGNIWVNKFLGTARRLPMSDLPQKCDTTNANILLVPKTIVEKVGIFYKGYIHGAADSDYAVMVRRAGFPVLITANACGLTEFDHRPDLKIYEDLAKMTLKERKKHFSNPLHSMSDHLTYIRRVFPIRYPLVLLGRMINIYTPKLFIFLHKIRTRQ